MPALLPVAKLCMLHPECKARSVSFEKSLAATTHSHKGYGKLLCFFDLFLWIVLYSGCGMQAAVHLGNVTYQHQQHPQPVLQSGQLDLIGTKPALYEL